MKPGLSFTRSLKGNNEFGDENLRELCGYDSNQDGGHVIDLVTFGFWIFNGMSFKMFHSMIAKLSELLISESTLLYSFVTNEKIEFSVFL